MRRHALIAFTALALSHAPAWGQVAAPSLLPATPGVADPTISTDPTLVPANPAMLGWPGPSKVGFGIVRSAREQERFEFTGQGGFSQEVPSISSQYEGQYGGVHFATDRYGIAAQSMTIKSVSGSADLDDSRNKIAIGTPLGGLIAVGVGYHADRDRQNNEDTRTSGYSAGASLRIGDRFYLGAGAGKDDSRRRTIEPSGGNTNGSSTIRVAGLGFMSQGALRLHAEVWAATVDGKLGRNGSGSQAADLQSAAIEAKYNSFVLGIAALQTSGEFSTDSGTIESGWQASEVTVGVAADRGFAALYHYGFGSSQTNFKADIQGIHAQVKSTAKSQTLSVFWLY